MKAVRVGEYGGPDVLKVEEIPLPVPGAGQFLLKVIACGINPLDAWFRSGHFAARFNRTLPYTPGTDVVGTVVEQGEGADLFAVGDTIMGVLPVLSDGGYAEYTVIDQERVTAVPVGLDPIQAAAAMTPAITGVQMVEKALSLGPCERMLIIGALGGVGRAAVVTALAHGVSVAVAVRSGREGAARALGVHQIVTNNDIDQPDALGNAFDVVLDLVGPDQVALWERAIAADGKVVSVVPLQPAASARTDVTFTPFAFSPSAESTQSVATMLRDGTLTVPDIEVLALGETGKAHAVLPAKAAGRKFVVMPAR